MGEGKVQSGKAAEGQGLGPLENEWLVIMQSQNPDETIIQIAGRIIRVSRHGGLPVHKRSIHSKNLLFDSWQRSSFRVY